MWELDYKVSWVLKNWWFWIVVLEKTLESPLDCKEIQPVHLKGAQSWVFIGRTDVEAETPILWPPDEGLTHLKRPWCWERLRAGGEGDHRGWDGWMASPTRWTWVWVDARSWWWTGRPGVLRFMGSQRVGCDWTELNWTVPRIRDACLARLSQKWCCAVYSASIQEAHDVCVVTADVKGLPPSPKEALRFGWVLLVYWFVNSRNVLLRVLEAGSLRSGSQHGWVLLWPSSGSQATDLQCEEQRGDTGSSVTLTRGVIPFGSS